MKKILKSKLFISSILCLISATILLLIEVKFNLTLFLLNQTSFGWARILLIIAIILIGELIINVLLLLRKQSKKPPIIFTIAAFISVFIIFVIVLEILVFTKDSKYFVFDSPDKKHSFVVEEEGLLLAEDANIYERVNILFMKYIDINDIGCRAFSNNDYKLNWSEDKLTIIYGCNSEVMDRRVQIKLTQQ